jgi:hypothetical protein
MTHLHSKGFGLGASSMAGDDDIAMVNFELGEEANDRDMIRDDESTTTLRPV